MRARNKKKTEAHLHAQPIPDDLAFTITRVLRERVVERVVVDVVGQVSYEESEPGCYIQSKRKKRVERCQSSVLWEMRMEMRVERRKRRRRTIARYSQGSHSNNV
jgi:hypothetical protein